MNKKSLLAVVTAILMSFLVSGCGTTRTLLGLTASATPLSKGVTLAQTRNLFGIGGTEPMFIIANYSGGDSQTDVTGEAKYVSSDPSVVTVSNNGILEVVAGFCDWVSETAVDPTLVITVTATFQTQSTTVFVNVNSLAGCPGPITQQ